jgi:chemotaxis protein CheX
MPQIDASFFKPFVEGTLKTFKVQCKTDASHESPFFKGTKPEPTFAIAGVIDIASVTFTGRISLCLPEPVFLGMMERMLEEPFPEITPELQDGVAELLNMIFGQAKVTLNEQGHTIQKAIPKVVTGDELNGNGAKVIVLPFKTDLGVFHIEIRNDS